MGPSQARKSEMPLLVLLLFLGLGVLWPIEQFIFNGFTSTNLIFDDMVMVGIIKLLMLTNNTNQQGPCLVLVPLQFHMIPNSTGVQSFSKAFVINDAFNGLEQPRHVVHHRRSAPASWPAAARGCCNHRSPGDGVLL
uniref:Uncharacterized protein n=1 Tax=Oryza punctata TaxID=4537 RepID=A0A0E0KYL1_ORYPU